MNYDNPLSLARSLDNQDKSGWDVASLIPAIEHDTGLPDDTEPCSVLGKGEGAGNPILPYYLTG